MTHSLTQGCPICQGTLQPLSVMPRLKTARCPRCGHRVATHESETASTLDYHRQYDQGVFLDSLRATRKRQAECIIKAIRRALPDCDQVLDYGAGRGWFLDACRDAGMREVAAADTSAMAVEAARARGIAGLLVNDDGSDLDVAALPFAPRVLTLLDVIEHFPPTELRPRIDALLRALPSVQIVVVKVPVSSGPLHASATLMARIGLGGALEQLYQVGTNPPHFNYFSRSSLRRLLKQCGLTPIEMFGDLDFEPRLLPDRVHLLRGLPGAVKWPISWLAVAICRLLPTRDSMICLSATVARSQPPEV
jgi:SAM-dependent methyltransferase